MRSVYLDYMNHDRIVTLVHNDPKMRTATGHVAEGATGCEVVPGLRPDSRFQVTVVGTTRKGTLAALKTAAVLAKDMGAPLTLAMIEVLRPHLSLQLPSFMVDFFEKRAFALISDARIREQAVTIQIWLCHDRKKCLRQALSLRTLVVIGGTKHWWRPDDRKLEEWLCRQGYPVVFADAQAKSFTELIPQSHRDAILHRVVKNSDQRIISSEGD